LVVNKQVDSTQQNRLTYTVDGTPINRA